MQLMPLLRDDQYQVFLLICPATLPFSFATHPWFVVNRKGTLMWYSVSWRKAEEGVETFSGHVCRGCLGYLHKDNRSFGTGIEIFPFISGFLWGGHVVSFMEGGDDSLARRMLEYIERSIEIYPYADRYSLLGPNSNTYPAWVLAQFPESGMKLPWNSFGKGYSDRDTLTSIAN